MTVIRGIERAFRYGVVYPLFRTLLSNEVISLPIDLKHVRRLLVLRTDRLGDMVVTSSLIRRIKERAPDVELGLVVSHKGVAAARLLDGVDHVHVIGVSASETWHALQDARKLNYDVVLNLVFNRTTLGGLLANVIAPRGIKVGQGDTKYHFYFNAMVSLERGRAHMAETLESFGVKTFGPSFAGTSLPYGLHDIPSSVQFVERWLKRLPAPPVLVNLSASERPRAPRAEQMRDLIAGILGRTSAPVAVTAAPGDAEVRASVIRSLASPRVFSFPEEGTAQFSDLVALIRRSHILVTPDTSLVHVAGATGTPLLGLYSTAFSLAEWAPRNTVAEIVLNKDDRPLSEMPVEQMLEGFDRLVIRMPS